jgi:hypothetical protein
MPPGDDPAEAISSLTSRLQREPSSEEVSSAMLSVGNLPRSSVRARRL